MTRPLLGAALAALLAAATARAHDIPDARIDRAIQLMLRPGRLEIGYEVSLAELTLVRDFRALVGTLPEGDRLGLFERYGREVGPLNAKGFLVAIDGRPIELRYDRHDLAVEEHPRFTFHLSAPLPKSGHLELRDTNYASSEGTSRLALRAEGVGVRGYDGPSDVEGIAPRPLWQLSDEEERRTRAVEVDFGPEPAPPAAAAAPPEHRRRPPPRRDDRLSDLLTGARRGSPLALGLIALVLGAAHAIQPGHGKTLVAAASLAPGGGWPRGAALAVVTTVAHMGSVAVLALLLTLARPWRYEAIDATLVAASGFAIAAVGCYRLGRHVAGRAEHAEPGHPGESGGGLVGLGIAGGLVPCWDAILLVLLADALGRLPLGLFLLAMFSAGMGAILVAVGLLAGRLRRSILGEARWERPLGLVSGTLLAAIGLTMLLR